MIHEKHAIYTTGGPIQKIYRYIKLKTMTIIRIQIYATKNNLKSLDQLYLIIQGHKCHGHYFHGNGLIHAKASRVRIMSVMIMSDKYNVVLTR